MLRNKALIANQLLVTHKLNSVCVIQVIILLTTLLTFTIGGLENTQLSEILLRNTMELEISIFQTISLF